MLKKKPGRPAKPTPRYYLASLYPESTIDEVHGPFDTPQDAVDYAEVQVREGAEDDDTEFVVLAASTEKFSFKEPEDTKLILTKTSFL